MEKRLKNLLLLMQIEIKWLKRGHWIYLNGRGKKQ